MVYVLALVAGVDVVCFILPTVLHFKAVVVRNSAVNPNHVDADSDVDPGYLMLIHADPDPDPQHWSEIQLFVSPNFIRGRGELSTWSAGLRAGFQSDLFSHSA